MLNTAVSLCKFTGPSNLNSSLSDRLKRLSKNSVSFGGQSLSTSSLAAGKIPVTYDTSKNTADEGFMDCAERLCTLSVFWINGFNPYA